MQLFLGVSPYRLPAVPLHRAVVVFHHPGMVQQLSNSQTPLWVHLQDTHRNCNSRHKTTDTTICRKILQCINRNLLFQLWQMFLALLIVSTSVMIHLHDKHITEFYCNSVRKEDSYLSLNKTENCGKTTQKEKSKQKDRLHTCSIWLRRRTLPGESHCGLS